MQVTRKQLLGLVLVGFTGIAATTGFSQGTRGSVLPPRVDVAMDGLSFSFEGAVNEAGFPAEGTPFVISGYIYPGGTFARYGSLSGTNADGSPEFPEEVIGTWICRGWHLQDGDAVTGPVVATTQIFDLDTERPGSQTVITEGIELADFNVPFRRAITGGTGAFSGLTGEHGQAYVGNGVNASGGFNATFIF